MFRNWNVINITLTYFISGTLLYRKSKSMTCDTKMNNVLELPLNFSNYAVMGAHVLFKVAEFPLSPL